MAVIDKINPVGLDLEISKMQQLFYKYHTQYAAWGNYQSYPRAYVNEKEGGTIPELYTGKNEYKECLFDDTFNATSFFLAGGNVRYNDGAKLIADVSLIYQADLRKLYPSILHRADEEMHADIYNAIYGTKYVAFLESIISGVENVYADLKLPESYLERVKKDDMSNYHVVKINFSLPYVYKSC